MARKNNELHQSLVVEKAPQLMFSVHTESTIIIFQYSSLLVAMLNADEGLVTMQFGPTKVVMKVKSKEGLKENFYGELAVAIRTWQLAALYDSTDWEIKLEKEEQE